MVNFLEWQDVILIKIEISTKLISALMPGHFKKLASIPLLLICLHVESASAAEVQTSTLEQANFQAQMGLDGYKSVEYRDAQGKQISFQQFQSMLNDHVFSVEKQKTGGQSFAVVRLKGEQVPAAPAAVGYKVKSGSAFPKFKLQSTDGVVVTNAALLGRYTLISFYFAECAPCIKEVPMLNAFAEKHKDLTTLAVTFDSRDEAKGFAKRTNFSWRTVVKGNELIKKVGVRGYPSFALLDPQGKLVAISDQVEAGANDGALEKWVDQAIGRK